MSVANQRSTPAGAKVNNEVKNLNTYTCVYRFFALAQDDRCSVCSVLQSKIPLGS